jgi:hypothetical protein
MILDEKEIQNSAYSFINIFSRLKKKSPVTVNIFEQHSDQSANINDFIQSIYSKSYDADIKIEYPVLLSVKNVNDKILCAAGVRFAKNNNLFLEQYTKMPIEKVLKIIFEEDVSRDKICEVGNLSSIDSAATIFLFKTLARYLFDLDKEYVVITSTNTLYKILNKVGLKGTIICQAKYEDLNNSNEYWGSYYDKNPIVVAYKVSENLTVLENIINEFFELPVKSLKLSYEVK